MMAENDYVQAASSKSYQLPEYTTGFLLAKDVKMQFSGVDSATASHAIQQSAAGSLSFSLGPFKAKGSFSAGHKSSSLKVSTSANSLQIEVPGAQIIGYYTSVLPKFPS